MIEVRLSQTPPTWKTKHAKTKTHNIPLPVYVKALCVHLFYFAVLLCFVLCLPPSHISVFSPCSAVFEVDLRFESTLEDHALPPAVRNADCPSYGWVSPLCPCPAIRFESLRWKMPLPVKQYALQGLLVFPLQRLHLEEQFKWGCSRK